jgi:hypothetical protein
MFIDFLAFDEISRSASMLRLSCAGRSYRQQDYDHACVQKRYSTNLPKVDEGIHGVSTATLMSSIGTSSNSFVGTFLHWEVLCSGRSKMSISIELNRPPEVCKQKTKDKYAGEA